MNWVAEHLDSLLAPRETYLDHYQFMAGLSGEMADQVAAAGFVIGGHGPAGTRRH